MAVGVLVVAVLCLAMSRRWIAGMLVAVALTLGADVLWSGLVSAQTEAGAVKVEQPAMARVMFANVLRSNPSLADLMVWLNSENPDVLVMTEVTPGHVEEIAELMAGNGYAHQVLEPRHHAFGMTIYSRLPIVDYSFETLTDNTLSEGGPNTVIARIETGQGVLAVAGVHPFPPSIRASMEARNRQLDDAVYLLEDIKDPLIVVGDYNATPWSPACGGLPRHWICMASTSLRRGRSGSVLQESRSIMHWSATNCSSVGLRSDPISAPTIAPSSSMSFWTCRWVIRDRRARRSLACRVDRVRA